MAEFTSNCMNHKTNKTNKSPKNLLATSLERVSSVSHMGIVKTGDISRQDRQRLIDGGWLKEIIKGWYLLTSRPDTEMTEHGDTSLWFSHFWDFTRIFLSSKYANNYCLSAENSLDLHTGVTTIPKQIVVIVSKGGGNNLLLPSDTSILAYPDSKNLPIDVDLVSGVQIMKLPEALSRVSKNYFTSSPVNAQLALMQVNESDLSRYLIEKSAQRPAGRLMGAYTFLGNESRSRRIKKDMRAIGYRIQSENPYLTHKPTIGVNLERIHSPYTARIQMIWESMRDDVIKIMPHSPGLPIDQDKFMQSIDDVYEHDAYNSLSIEGYKVTPELIAKIRNGDWDPDKNEDDKSTHAALAAKGYLTSFTEVKSVIKKIISGKSSPELVKDSLHDWYSALFSASVQAGVIKATDIAGHRNRPVFIRNSRHVPPPYNALSDCMDTLHNLLKEEESPAVRAVLGHFILAYIHPYPDGNGRTSRFLMNTMFASGGYPWVVVQLKNRDLYMNALESASTKGDIKPFSEYIKTEMKHDWN